MKKKLNKILRKLGAEIHGIGYIEKLKNESTHKNEWQKQMELLKGHAPVIFDVGANRGDTAKKYVELFKNTTIHAFEPFPETCTIFKQKHQANKNIILNQCALSSKIGSATLNVNNSVDTNSILQSKVLGATSDASCTTITTVEIETNTIDNYCKVNNILMIDILKIDVQGFEVEVLKGAIEMLQQQKIKLIYTESYFVQQYVDQPLFHQIAAMLYQYGFTLQDIYDPYYSLKNILWCDAMFINQKYFN